MNPLDTLRLALTQGEWCWVTEIDEPTVSSIQWRLGDHLGLVKVHRQEKEDWQLVRERCVVVCVEQLRKVFGGEHE